MPTATILVTDLVGSTELRARLGEEQAERLRRLHDRLLRTAVETHGGTVVKGLGDGVLASFPEASGALASAVAIQQAADAHTRRHPELPLALRVGLSAGDVTLDEGDCFGTPVVEASRLCASAHGGQILAAEVVRLLVKGRGGYTLGAVGELALKGLAEPVATFEVSWEAPSSVVLPFPDLLRTAGALDFAGRRSELELLVSAWKEAQAGERHGVLVGGEPGVGKTRLAAELARSVHEAGGAVLYGRCQEGLGVPYEPFVEALTFFCEHSAAHALRPRLGRYPGELARLLPDVGDLVPGLDPPLRSDPETEQYRLFEAVASWLAAAGEAGGLVFVVDDLHWAPAPTLSLLLHLLRAAGPARLLVVGTFRDTEIGPTLTPALADLRRIASVERVSLRGLSVDELSEFLDAAFAGALHEETKGNPFFVGEVLRHTAESGVPAGNLPVPESVQEVIVSRVARLSPTTGELLGVAAVLGRDVELGPLTAVAGITAAAAVEALDEALTARLMEELSVGGYRFVHALVRSALYETLSTNRRAQLHLRAADAFEADPARLAHHLLACAPLGGAVRTAAACLAAGNRALAALADAEAAEWYSQGLGYADDDIAQRIDLLTGLGEAQRRTGDPASRETLLLAARLAEGDVPRLVRAVVCNSRSFFTVSPRQVDDARLELLQRALDLVGTAPTAERAELLSLQATELIFTGDHHAVLEKADEAGAIAAQVDDVGLRARVGTRRVFACQSPERAEAVAAETTDLIVLADASGDPQLRVTCRRPTAPMSVGDLGTALRRMTEAMAIADDTGQPGLRARAHFDYAGPLDALGHHDEALRLSQAALELGRQAGWPDAIYVFGGRMALHWIFEGQAELLVARAAQVLAESPRLMPWRAAWAGGLAVSGGNDDLARFLAELGDVLPHIPVDHFWLSNHFAFAFAQGFGVENRDSAAALYDLLLPHRALHVTYGVGYWGPVEMGLAITARVIGDLDAALAHHHAAAATIEACGAARARALNGYQWARTLVAHGNHQAALTMAEETLAYCREKGYMTFVAKTEDLLASLR